jgi:SAM-dependent methyltransferase
MNATQLKKIKTKISRLGFYNFLLFTIQNQYQSYRFKIRGILYPEDTGSYVNANQQSVHQDSKINQSCSYFSMKKGFKALGKKYAELSLLDIGCGDGKVLNFAMLYNFKRVIGIDLDASAVKNAMLNCEIMNKNGFNTPYNVYYTDASEYTIPAGTNVIFLFNPFGKQTMQTVLNNIIRYCNVDKTELYIIYVVPVHRDLFDEHKQLLKTYEFLKADKTAEILVYKTIYQ